MLANRDGFGLERARFAGDGPSDFKPSSLPNRSSNPLPVDKGTVDLGVLLFVSFEVSEGAPVSIFSSAAVVTILTIFRLSFQRSNSSCVCVGLDVSSLESSIIHSGSSSAFCSKRAPRPQLRSRSRSRSRSLQPPIGLPPSPSPVLDSSRQDLSK